MHRFLLLAFGLLAATASYAQPSTGGPAPQTPSPTAVPLDGGASLLAVSGVAYGLRYLRQLRKRA